MQTKSFRDLIVWQKSRDLGVEIYKLTKSMPKEELYGMVSQMRRAAISISSNIAEGYNRAHPIEKRQFMRIAYGSGSELESQIEVAKIIYPKLSYKLSESLLLEVLKILNKFINR
ncbi:MAG: four helix bundle protein [Patescibacteria group bacterium]|nr:four helix bundle protein [Patescibacteria group bacterium]